MAHGDLSLFYTFFFYLFGLISIVSALLFVTRKSAVAAAMWLVCTLFALAALYVMLDAQFIGIIQVLVYAGAIMVVFLFVIMLLNLGEASAVTDARSLAWKLVAGLAGIALVSETLAVLRARAPDALRLPPHTMALRIAEHGAIEPFAAPLFREYLLAFEVTSVLLLAAVIGAVLLAKRRTDAAQ